MQSFELNGEKFKRLKVPSAPENPGFYQVLHEGNELHLYAKRIKEEIVRTTLDYRQRDKYFLMVNGIKYDIKNKASFLKVFPDRKSEIRKFVKRNGIIVKVGMDTELKMLTAYCEELLESK